MLRRWSLVLALLAVPIGPLVAGPIEDLRPGEWYRVPNSKMEVVYPEPWPPGTIGPRAVMDSWCSGGYDTKRDRLIVWGGGHENYSGNELYVFDVNRLAWERITDPSYNVSGTGPYYPDGKPRSRHSYDYLEYIPPPFDRFCTFGGASVYPGHHTDNVDCFNFDNLQWQSYGPTPSFGIGAPAVWDPVGGHLWQHGASASPTKLAMWNPATNTWTIRGDYQPSLQWVHAAVGVIDPVRRKYLIVGNGVCVSFNIAAGGIIPMVNLKPLTTGADEIEDSNTLGLAYDPVIDRIVAWDGGTDVYLLNLDTLIWTRQPPATTNTVIPTAPNSVGTYGRFRYIPSKNAFIVVNHTNEDVYFYKLAAGGGLPPDSNAPKTVTDLRPR